MRLIRLLERVLQGSSSLIARHYDDRTTISCNKNKQTKKKSQPGVCFTHKDCRVVRPETVRLVNRVSWLLFMFLDELVKQGESYWGGTFY